jgi:hypothetical protein
MDLESDDTIEISSSESYEEGIRIQDIPLIRVYFHLNEIRYLLSCYFTIPTEIISIIMVLFTRLLPSVHPNNILNVKKFSDENNPCHCDGNIKWLNAISKGKSLFKPYCHEHDNPDLSQYRCSCLKHEFFEDCKQIWIERIGEDNLYIDKGYRHCPVKPKFSYGCHNIIDITYDKICKGCQRYCCYNCFVYGKEMTCTQCRKKPTNLYFMIEDEYKYTDMQLSNMYYQTIDSYNLLTI